MKYLVKNFILLDGKTVEPGTVLDEKDIDKPKDWIKERIAQGTFVKVQAEEKEEDTEPPQEDGVDTVPGIGAGTKTKLEALGITTIPQLKGKIDSDEVKTALGSNHENIKANLENL